MAIECNVIYPNGPESTIIPPNPVKHLGRIEVGMANVYRCSPDELGAVVLAGCHDMDLGGRVYVLNEETLSRTRDKDGCYSSEKLAAHYCAVLPPGGSLAVPVIRNGDIGFTLLFTHLSPN